MAHRYALLLASSACYGFSLGAAHDLIYAQRNLVKFPLLLLVTGTVCAIAWFVMARLVTTRLVFVEIQRLAFGMSRDLSFLLASLAPVNLFLAWIMVRDDDPLGDYDLFFGANVIFVAIGGCLALLHQGRKLAQAARLGLRRTLAVLTMWLSLTLCVGGQAAFTLRPLFGLPATRGQTPPWALGTTPDVRGARNFFEMVVQVVRRPPLPRTWPRSR